MTIGYDFMDERIVKVDGVPIEGISHLITVLGQNADKEFVEFELESGEKIVLDRKEAQKENPKIMARQFIVKCCSDDLKSTVEDAERQAR